MKIIINIILFYSLSLGFSAFAQTDGSAGGAIPRDTPDASTMPAPTAIEATTKTPIPTENTPVPTPTPTPPPTDMPTSSPSTSPELEETESGLSLFSSVTIPALITILFLAIFGGYKGLISKQGQKKSENKCDSIKEILEQKKKELEEMIKSWPENKAKAILESKVIEQLSRDDETRKIIELKKKYDKAKKTIEMLEKRYDLCNLSIPTGGQIYHGVIVENSLTDPKILENIKITKTQQDDDWLLHTVSVNTKQIEKFGSCLNPGPWYMNFWRDDSDDGIIVFKEKSFNIKYSDKKSWEDAIRYGKSIDIPERQLDFKIES